jgi:hypothetical protein
VSWQLRELWHLLPAAEVAPRCRVSEALRKSVRRELRSWLAALKNYSRLVLVASGVRPELTLHALASCHASFKHPTPCTRLKTHRRKHLPRPRQRLPSHGSIRTAPNKGVGVEQQLLSSSDRDLNVIQPQSREAPLIGYKGGFFYVKPIAPSGPID